MGTSRLLARALALGILALPSALPAATSAYHARVALSAPILYYQFNEASGPALNYGSLGAGYNATYFGTPTRQAATLAGDGGVAFLALGDYLESLGVAPAGLTGNPTFSAEALFMIPASGGAGLWAPFLHWGPSPLGSEPAKSVYFSFSHNDSTAAFAGFYDGGLKSAAGSIPRDRWHHLLWVRIGGGNAITGSTVYIDGVDVSATLIPDPDLPFDSETPTVGATEFRVNRARDLDSSRYFIGTLDELALYDRALTAQEVNDHFIDALDRIFADGFEAP